MASTNSIFLSAGASALSARHVLVSALLGRALRSVGDESAGSAVREYGVFRAC